MNHNPAEFTLTINNSIEQPNTKDGSVRLPIGDYVAINEGGPFYAVYAKDPASGTAIGEKLMTIGVGVDIHDTAKVS